MSQQDSNLSYREATAEFFTVVLPRLRKEGWRQFVSELVASGQVAPADARAPRWRTPNTGRLIGEDE